MCGEEGSTSSSSSSTVREQLYLCRWAYVRAWKCVCVCVCVCECLHACFVMYMSACTLEWERTCAHAHASSTAQARTGSAAVLSNRPKSQQAQIQIGPPHQPSQTTILTALRPLEEDTLAGMPGLWQGRLRPHKTYVPKTSQEHVPKVPQRHGAGSRPELWCARTCTTPEQWRTRTCAAFELWCAGKCAALELWCARTCTAPELCCAGTCAALELWCARTCTTPELWRAKPEPGKGAQGAVRHG